MEACGAPQANASYEGHCSWSLANQSPGRLHCEVHAREQDWGKGAQVRYLFSAQIYPVCPSACRHALFHPPRTAAMRGFYKAKLLILLIYLLESL